MEIEKLKSQLAMAAAERQVRFSRLHDKRAEVVAEVYRLLVGVHNTVEFYIGKFSVAEHFKPPIEHRRQAALDALAALTEYFSPRRIFIPKTVADKIGDISSKYSDTSLQFFIDVERLDYTDPKKQEEWNRAAELIASLSKTAAADLGQEFRRLLGDDTGKVS